MVWEQHIVRNLKCKEKAGSESSGCTLRVDAIGGNQSLWEIEGVVRESRRGYAEGWRERRWKGRGKATWSNDTRSFKV